MSHWAGSPPNLPTVTILGDFPPILQNYGIVSHLFGRPGLRLPSSGTHVTCNDVSPLFRSHPAYVAIAYITKFANDVIRLPTHVPNIGQPEH